MTNITLEDIPLDDDRVAFVEAKPSGWAGFVDVEKFQEALKKEGVPEDMWPLKPTPGKRLERAMKAQRVSRNILIRPLTKSNGWSLVVENDDKLALEGEEEHKTAHSVDLTCKVHTVGDATGVNATPWDHPSVESVRKEFTRFENVFKCSEDLSQWFSRRIVPWCQGVATRSRGGSYYIMKGKNLDRMRGVAKALEAVSQTTETPLHIGEKEINIVKVHVGGRLLLKPEVASTAAVEILMNNFIDECEQISTNIRAKVKTGKLGKRALSTQKDLAGGQLSKLDALETLLDTKLDDLTDTLNKAKEEAGMAALHVLSKE